MHRETVIAVGDVLVLHDADTGASLKSVVRPCMVVVVRPASVVVAPRSASAKGLISTPPAASTAFSTTGNFSKWRLPVSRVIADAAPNHGQLAEPYRSKVLALFARRRTS